jgi:poly(3-hydroxybutyrate) depolymerase
MAYPGTCPFIDSGAVQLSANGFARSVQVYLPDQPGGAGVLFLWHGLGDKAKNIGTAFGAAQIAKAYNLIVVAPDSCCNTAGASKCCNQLSGWSFVANHENDLSLFDGMLSCLDQTYAIDRKRVFTAGFSAGALWSTYLVMHRADYLAAAAIFSGGINNVLPWSQPARKVPVIDTSGGANDTFGPGDPPLVDFQASVADLNVELRKAGHFVVHCQHSLGHTVPGSMAKWAFDFLDNHGWADGPSPWAGGLPAGSPAGCEIVP